MRDEPSVPHVGGDGHCSSMQWIRAPQAPSDSFAPLTHSLLLLVNRCSGYSSSSVVRSMSWARVVRDSHAATRGMVILRDEIRVEIVTASTI